MSLGKDPIFGVSDFVAVFNQSLEVMYPRVGIVGELFNFRVSRGTWVYFDLVDDQSSIKFFGTARQVSQPLEDGMRLEVFGRPRLHPKYGFSINVETLRPVGKGSIKKAQDLLAQKLKSEGLFDDARKRQLPRFPERAGVITAEKSAAFADFCKIITNRWGGLNLQLIDVAVQGISSADEISAAIETFNELAEPPEVVVLIRGGGSPEDLASFSEEKVVRAVASSRVPTIVAIGHETDISLAELTADLRGSTPSNAAELLVPDHKNERSQLQNSREMSRDSLLNKVGFEKKKFSNDRETTKLGFMTVVGRHTDYLEYSKQIIDALNPEQPLKKGYAIVRKDDKVVKSSKELKTLDDISITLRDGTIKGRIN